MALAACDGTPSGGAPNGSGGSTPMSPASGGSPSNPGGGGAPAKSAPGAPDPSYVALKASADAARAMDGADVAKAYPTAFEPLSYDPLSATYLDKLQQSALKLNDVEQTALGKNGFVLASRQFPTFVNGYAEIYSEHLPVYISADALLESVHNAYDAMLAKMEQSTIIGKVTALLQSMRTRLPTSTADPPLRADVDVYLAVALSLLQGSAAAPVAGGDASTVGSFVAAANAAMGTGTVSLFGDSRQEDFSQFTPRGHYTDDPVLSQYFRAMIWLGRIDLRLVETAPSGDQVFHREQYDAMLLMRELIGSDVTQWSNVDDILKTFVGKSDNMIVPDVDSLITDLGGADAAHAASDDAVEKALVKGGYGQQQIASYLMVNDGTVATLPLNRSFLIFGQRYTVDSDVFSAVVYDRIPGRFMPDPLDAAFGAFGNNQALALDPDAATNPALPGALARVRTLIDSSDASFWQSSFYNLWLGALRALSPAPDAASTKAGLPQIATTEAWGRRILDTQLGSWAELRHDTLLYAKQSYTGSPGCDFPDAYVDPYPDTFAAIRKYAEQGGRIAAFAPPDDATLINAYFDTLRNASAVLEQIATAELQGEALTADQLAFINDAVRINDVSVVCTTIQVPDGWLAKLYFNPPDSIVFKPTIADVHTQPSDAGGNPVGNVLHVGNGFPRFMVATVDSCGGGPRAYAGVVFGYAEKVTSNFERLTDDQWASQLNMGDVPPDVPWLSPVIAH
jgi:hypothetical protein